MKIKIRFKISKFTANTKIYRVVEIKKIHVNRISKKRVLHFIVNEYHERTKNLFVILH